MNARTFVSNADGAAERIEITELEHSAGRTVRVMFDGTADDLVLSMDEHGVVNIRFYSIQGSMHQYELGRKSDRRS